MGVKEFCSEIGARHQPKLMTNSFLSPRLDSLFERAASDSTTEITCFVAADTILPTNFSAKLQKLFDQSQNLLVVGKPNQLPQSYHRMLKQRGKYSISNDEFALMTRETTLLTRSRFYAFSKGIWGYLPPLALGSVHWSNFLVINGLLNCPDVVDATQFIPSLHQEHNYTHSLWGTYERLYSSIESRLDATMGPESTVAEFIDQIPVYCTEDGQTLKRQGTDPKLIEEARRITELMRPRHAQRLSEEALILDREGRSNDALKLLDKSYSIFTELPGYGVFRSIFLLNLNRYEEALAAAKTLLADPAFKSDAERMIDMINVARSDPNEWNQVRRTQSEINGVGEPISTKAELL